ncbi:hypothetical protein [Corynebacterium sp. Marseille-P4321]|uniref:hypothetical protein n=1 Tax=Corynebacterium sp. Marseille-P4321 TaxID=2736603 RepID=UPI00158F369C|nr:hypothetical protein [Corynebacterium sp. Marseille-P4321]
MKSPTKLAKNKPTNTQNKMPDWQSSNYCCKKSQHMAPAHPTRKNHKHHKHESVHDPPETIIAIKGSQQLQPAHTNHTKTMQHSAHATNPQTKNMHWHTIEFSNNTSTLFRTKLGSVRLSG